MSEQLTNTGMSGLLAMLGTSPATGLQSGTATSGGVMGFGSIMQAQGAGFGPPQFDADGQPLPQSGGTLPPSSEMLAKMQAQIDAKSRAPELSQVVSETTDPDLRASLLTEDQSLRDGVVMETQWPGVLPKTGDLPLESPEVVALVQNAFDGQEEAQHRLSETMSVLKASAEVASNEALSADDGLDAQESRNINASSQIMQASQAEVQVPAVPVTPSSDNPDENRAMPVSTAPNSGVKQSAQTQEVDADNHLITRAVEHNPMVNVEQHAMTPLRTTSDNAELNKEPAVNPLLSQADDLAIEVQEELALERIAVQIAAGPTTAERATVDGQQGGVAAAIAPKESQVGRANEAGGPRLAAPDVSLAQASQKDVGSTANSVTQIASPVQGGATPQTLTSSAGQSIAPDVSQQAGIQTSRVDEVSARIAQESVDSDHVENVDDAADGWLRSETRAANQTTAAVDNLSRMNPAQVAFTMAGKGQMGSPSWNHALSERVMVMTAQNNQVAEIQLDPPELGSLKVRLQVGQDQVSVSFTSPHASVRDAVEQSMPRLREMMEEQGLNLGESSVNDQSSESGEEGGQRRFASQGGSELSGGADEAVSAPVSGEAVSLVDYYA